MTSKVNNWPLNQLMFYLHGFCAKVEMKTCASIKYHCCFVLCQTDHLQILMGLCRVAESAAFFEGGWK